MDDIIVITLSSVYIIYTHIKAEERFWLDVEAFPS